jgi:hypothetical protein
MRVVRFDQYESPSSRTILKRLGLWCVALLTPPLAFLFIGLVPDTAELWLTAAAALFLVAMWLGALSVLNQEYKEAAASYQMRRDKSALTLFNAVISGGQQKFAVFLRPFYTTDKIYTNQTIMVAQQQGGTTIMVPQVIGQHKLEDTLVEAFRSTLPVVALGKPGETFGVGRVLVDEDSWQKAAYELMQRASLVICLPSSRPGSLWEMNQIMLNHYFSKTVFIMPPNPPSFRTWKNLKEDWDLLKQEVASKGITIPEYKTDGLLFSVDATGQCVTEKLSLDSTRTLLETFIRLSSPVIRGWG